MQQVNWKEHRFRWSVASLVLLGSLTPPLVYLGSLVGTPTITAWQAKDLLRRRVPPAMLIDVRSGKQYANGHVDGAMNWPADKILDIQTAERIPSTLRDKTLLLVSHVGSLGRRATRHLVAIGTVKTYNVRGGIQEWSRSVPNIESGRFDRWRTADDRAVPFAWRESTLFEQVVAVVAFFAIKPIYTLLSAIVVLVLWRTRDPDLVALRWSMIFFFLGENACAVNVLVFKETSYLLEYFHSLGMALCLGFLAFSVLEAIDHRIVGLSQLDRRCAALRLCGQCIKYSEVPCGLKRMFYMIIPLLIVLAMMLPTADWRDETYNTLVFGTLYNYGHLRVYQQLENWICPAAAVLLFVTSLVVLAWERENAVTQAKVAFAAGFGPLGFGMLRMIFGGAYSQTRVWYAFWEEATELMLLVGICFTLFTFRRQLLPEWDNTWKRRRDWIADWLEIE